MLQRLMHRWEHRLAKRDRNRITVPFEWGFEYLNHGFVPSVDSKASLFQFNEQTIQDSHSFFNHSPVADYEQKENIVRFASSISTPYIENNTVYCRIFLGSDRKRAVVLLPQWNADANSHVALSKLISRLGITTLRLTLPYHEHRNPAGPRADLMISSNMGRTIQAIQQSVTDARRAVDWLLIQGYQSIGIIGTSVGSCISYLTFLHDHRIKVGVFNHVSSYFGDVVWTGISTQHVRKGIEAVLNQEEVHRGWAVISPNSFVARLSDERRKLFISARYDLTFRPELSQLLLAEHDRCGVPYDVAFLPCGHYTTAVTPFKHLDGFLIANYLRKHL